MLSSYPIILRYLFSSRRIILLNRLLQNSEVDYTFFFAAGIFATILFGATPARCHFSINICNFCSSYKEDIKLVTQIRNREKLFLHLGGKSCFQFDRLFCRPNSRSGQEERKRSRHSIAAISIGRKTWSVRLRVLINISQ